MRFTKIKAKTNPEVTRYSQQMKGSSSVPSPQSSTPSQTHLIVMHEPVPHWNWLDPHVVNKSVTKK